MKRALFLMFFAAAALRASFPDPHARDKVTLDSRKEGNRTFLRATNTDTRITRYIEVAFQRADNVVCDRAMPLRAVLRPGESRELGVVSVLNPSRDASYALVSAQNYGDPDRQPDPSVPYLLPWEHGIKRQLGQGYNGQFTHQNLYALDFQMPEGTTICASRGGVIAALKDDSDVGGASPAYARLGNYVEVLHDDGSWAIYAHLMQHGGLVHEGDLVKAGDPIALSGQTGQANGPHLHFSVQHARWGAEPESFATQFAIDASHNEFLKEGNYYYAWHPGGPEFERIDAAAIDERKFEGIVRPAKPGKPTYRVETVDNRQFYYFSNSMKRPIKVTVNYTRKDGAETSKPLPFSKEIPAKSEVFLFSATLKEGGFIEVGFEMEWAE